MYKRICPVCKGTGRVLRIFAYYSVAEVPCRFCRSTGSIAPRFAHNQKKEGA